jgi:hypothetical protein
VTSRYARLDSALRAKLHTWKLSPKESQSRLWDLCSHTGEVFVRAATADRARELAALAFRKHGLMTPGNIVESPWLSRALVRCEVVNDARFDNVDHAGVVYPAVELPANLAGTRVGGGRHPHR